jgi:hypothetical protein
MTSVVPTHAERMPACAEARRKRDEEVRRQTRGAVDGEIDDQGREGEHADEGGKQADDGEQAVQLFIAGDIFFEIGHFSGASGFRVGNCANAMLDCGDATLGDCTAEALRSRRRGNRK